MKYYYDSIFTETKMQRRRANFLRKCWLSHCLDRPQYLNYTKLKPPVRLVLFLLVFFLVTTFHRGVDCCSCRGAGGGGAGTPLAGLAPPPQLIPLIYSGYMSQLRQRGHSCMYKTRPPPAVTSPRSSRIAWDLVSPCQSPLRPCSLIFIS